MDLFIECLAIFSDALWTNIKPRWRVVTTALWLTFPLFYIAAIILEVATIKESNQ